MFFALALLACDMTPTYVDGAAVERAAVTASWKTVCKGLEIKENEEFQVDPAIKNMSVLISNMLEDSGDDYSEPVPLPGVPSKYLRHIISYCELHRFQKSETDLVFPLPSKIPAEFVTDANELRFIQQFSEDELIDLISATNFMHVPALFELCCAMIASDLKGKDFNQMKKKYGLEDVEFTPADEEEILREFPWIQAEADEKIAKLRRDTTA